MKRMKEYFTYEEPSAFVSVSNTPPRLFRQERDWTCSVACIRTLLSGRTAEVPSENEFIEKFGLVPGPHYTDEFLAKGMLSPARTVKTHKNFRPEEIGPIKVIIGVWLLRSELERWSVKFLGDGLGSSFGVAGCREIHHNGLAIRRGRRAR